MQTYEKIRNYRQRFLALTGLYVEEFDFLSNEFHKDWWNYYKYHTIKGKERIHPINQEPQDVVLQTTEKKLFFLLVYLKQHPTYEFLASSFNLSTGGAKEWSKILLVTLQKTMKRLGLQPCREADKIALALERLQVKTVNLDATERPVLRSLDNDVQKEYYSGKKKTHMVKNNLLATDQQTIAYLSETYEGSVHDKSICDEENGQYPSGIEIRQDSGYQGHNPQGVTIVQPEKKHKGKELSVEQKESNRKKSKLRVIVEHAISGIKRSRIVKEVARSMNVWMRDVTMEVCCALHNLRVISSLRAYARAHVRAHSINFRL